MTQPETCSTSGRPVDRCHEPCHWCDMSDLPSSMCALPCHGNVALPAQVDPEVIRGVEPSGHRVWPPREPVHEERDTRHRTRRPKPLASCRWSLDLEQWVTPEHTRDCRTNACRGCKPCGKDHCEMRGSCPNHVDHSVDLWTCPQCIGVCRSELAEVETLATLVDVELEHVWATEHAVTGPTAPIWTLRDVTDVANLAGPVADPEQLDGRRTRGDLLRGWCEYPRPEVDDTHPAAVLGRWEYLFRMNGGPQTALETARWPRERTMTVPTVSSAADYLSGLLDGPMPHSAVFERFAREIHHVLTALEEALSDSRKPELGAPCPKCAVELALEAAMPGGKKQRPPRLEKRYGHWCDDPKCKQEHDKTGAKDRWVCNRGHVFEEAEYRLRIGSEYLSRADALTADQMRSQYDVTPGTLRKWAERGLVHKRGRDSHGRLLYDVVEARIRLDESRGWCQYPRDTVLYPPSARATPVVVSSTGT
jgi:hypothetical protein